MLANDLPNASALRISSSSMTTVASTGRMPTIERTFTGTISPSSNSIRS